MNTAINQQLPKVPTRFHDDFPSFAGHLMISMSHTSGTILFSDTIKCVRVQQEIIFKKKN